MGKDQENKINEIHTAVTSLNGVPERLASLETSVGDMKEDTKLIPDLYKNSHAPDDCPNRKNSKDLIWVLFGIAGITLAIIRTFI